MDVSFLGEEVDDITDESRVTTVACLFLQYHL